MPKNSNEKVASLHLDLGNFRTVRQPGSDLVGALPVNLATSAATAALSSPLNLTKYETEVTAYEVQSLIGQARGNSFISIGPPGGNKYEIWNAGWKEADRATNRAAGINKVLAEPQSGGGLYGVTSTTQGKKLIE